VWDERDRGGNSPRFSFTADEGKKRKTLLLSFFSLMGKSMREEEVLGFFGALTGRRTPSNGRLNNRSENTTTALLLFPLVAHSSLSSPLFPLSFSPPLPPLPLQEEELWPCECSAEGGPVEVWWESRIRWG